LVDRAVKDAHFRVTNAEIGFDLRSQDRHDLAVHQRHRRRRHDEGERPPGRLAAEP
jgi:hypothetical protein